MVSGPFDVCVSGSGAVAMSLALSLSAEGWRVAWARGAAPAPSRPDVRTYALNARAIALLDRLRVWPSLKAFSTPVADMAIKGDGDGHLTFSSWSQHVSELAWIVDAAHLERLLAEALRYAPRVDIVAPLQGNTPPVPAHLLAICEGKHSDTRSALGISSIGAITAMPVWPPACGPRILTTGSRVSGSARQTSWPCCLFTTPSPVPRMAWCGRCPTTARGLCRPCRLPNSRLP